MLSYMVLALMAGTAFAAKDLSPHEERLYDALQRPFEGEHYNAWKAIMADDAKIEMGLAGTVSRGSFEEVVAPFQKILERSMMTVEPITTEKESGVFSFIWHFYGRFTNGCEVQFSGLNVNKFNEDGLVTDLKMYSDQGRELAACADACFAEKQEEQLK